MRISEIRPGVSEIFMAISKVNDMTVQLRDLNRKGAFDKLRKAKREHDRALDHYLDLAPPVKITTGNGSFYVEDNQPDRRK